MPQGYAAMGAVLSMLIAALMCIINALICTVCMQLVGKMHALDTSLSDGCA